MRIAILITVVTYWLFIVNTSSASLAIFPALIGVIVIVSMWLFSGSSTLLKHEKFPSVYVPGQNWAPLGISEEQLGHLSVPRDLEVAGLLEPT